MLEPRIFPLEVIFGLLSDCFNACRLSSSVVPVHFAVRPRRRPTPWPQQPQLTSLFPPLQKTSSIPHAQFRIPASRARPRHRLFSPSIHFSHLATRRPILWCFTHGESCTRGRVLRTRHRGKNTFRVITGYDARFSVFKPHGGPADPKEKSPAAKTCDERRVPGLVCEG